MGKTLYIGVQIKKPSVFFPIPFCQLVIVPIKFLAFSQQFDLTNLWFVKAPIYLTERSMHPPSPYAVNNPAIETNVRMHRHKQTSAEEFPERPGEPECSFFVKTGDCKFKFHCKFHHPKNRITRSPPCNLSDKGLPLRPVSYFIPPFYAYMETEKYFPPYFSDDFYLKQQQLNLLPLSGVG